MSRRSFISESRAHLVRSKSCIFQQGLQVSHDRIYAFQRCSKARTNIKIATLIAFHVQFFSFNYSKEEKKKESFPTYHSRKHVCQLSLLTYCMYSQNSNP